MMFCPKCGSLMTVKQVKNKPVMGCSCGYNSKEMEPTVKESVENNEKEIEVIEKEEEIYPLTDEACPECGHLKAFYWTKQTRAGDEPETKFFKCEKCKHTWRDYN
ncbi:MAG: transcription factor S [Candidatus Nanoarchaeia archaeon]|nr:transcription factor S [Candidatus Nanoarchaeia archaeon]